MWAAGLWADGFWATGFWAEDGVDPNPEVPTNKGISIRRGRTFWRRARR